MLSNISFTMFMSVLSDDSNDLVKMIQFDMAYAWTTTKYIQHISQTYLQLGWSLDFQGHFQKIRPKAKTKIMKITLPETNMAHENPHLSW